MGGFLGTNETLTRDRVKEIFREKQHSYFEPKGHAPRSPGRFPIAKNFVPARI